jgi:hypothetical protein
MHAQLHYEWTNECNCIFFALHLNFRFPCRAWEASSWWDMHNLQWYCVHRMPLVLYPTNLNSLGHVYHAHSQAIHNNNENMSYPAGKLPAILGCGSFFCCRTTASVCRGGEFECVFRQLLQGQQETLPFLQIFCNILFTLFTSRPTYEPVCQTH